jgi:hypothetical protein
MRPEEHEQLRQAAKLYRPIASAASLGRKNGLSLLIFGGISVLLSLSELDPVGFSIGAILTATGLVEFRISPRLTDADPSAPRILARNEVVLMACILTFCLLKLTVLRESGEALNELLGNTDTLGFDVTELSNSMNTLVYGVFIGVTLLYQGGMARYFLRCRPKIDTYLQECPEWARRIVAEL